MESLEQIVDRVRKALPGVSLEILANPSASAQHSLIVDREWIRPVAGFLRDDPVLGLDYCSNVTGVDWPPSSVKMKVRRVVDGIEKEVEEVRETAGHLEVIYHLYSMSRKHGPVVLRVRTADRSREAWVPSLTPLWRSCEFQEREVFDLFGVRFEGHPDLRRLLMWEGFADHPMRKDYAEPDDYEYEPTPHDRVFDRARAHHAGAGGAPGGIP